MTNGSRKKKLLSDTKNAQKYEKGIYAKIATSTLEYARRMW